MHEISVAGSARAREVHEKVWVWERSGPHRRVVSRAAERSGECASKRNHAPAGCTHMHMHTLTHVRAGERAHMRTHAYAPAGCMKSTHPKGARKTCTHPKGATTEAKRGHEKHNRTLTPAHTCDRVKIVRAESAPRMRTPAVSSRARARILHAPKGCMYPHLRVRFNEPGSEADRALRKEKECV